MPLTPTRAVSSLRILLLLSGFAGLVFEVLWTRQLSNVVGSTSVAMTCVFGVFIVCLSLGALIASRLRFFDRGALIAYAAAELGVGVFGFGVTMLMLHRHIWLSRWIPLTSPLKRDPAVESVQAELSKRLIQRRAHDTTRRHSFLHPAPSILFGGYPHFGNESREQMLQRRLEWSQNPERPARASRSLAE